MTYGPDRLLGDLRALGYEPDIISAADGTRFVLLRNFEVPCGRFVGRVIDLGVQATADFPRSVASAIHVRSTPLLFDYTDTQPGVRNITASVLGGDWRYWSHNFGWQGEKHTRRLMSQVNGIFANA